MHIEEFPPMSNMFAQRISDRMRITHALGMKRYGKGQKHEGHVTRKDSMTLKPGKI